MEDWQIEERQSQMVNSLASDLIADIISARIRLDSFPNKLTERYEQVYFSEPSNTNFFLKSNFLNA